MLSSKFFSRVPQFLNWMLFELTDKKGAKVAYEPIHLHVQIPAASDKRLKYYYGNASSNNNNSIFLNQDTDTELDRDSFKFMLKQVPTIQTIEFSGWGEPLRNPAIFDFINDAYAFNKAQSTIYSHGFFTPERFRQLFTSKTHRLLINILAHRPSLYSIVSKQPPNHFLAIKHNIEQLLLVKEHYPKSPLFIELAMVVDRSSLSQIPEMIEFAEELGVDGIRFDTIVSHDPESPIVETLYSHDESNVQFLEDLKQKDYSIQVTLPVLLEQDMSEHRNCQDPHQSASITNDLHVSPCSHFAIFEELTSNIWDDGFWNDEQYQWLRGIHGESTEAVPNACQNCPKNIATPASVLNKKIFTKYEEHEKPKQNAASKESWLKKSAMWSFFA